MCSKNLGSVFTGRGMGEFIQLQCESAECNELVMENNSAAVFAKTMTC